MSTNDGQDLKSTNTPPPLPQQKTSNQTLHQVEVFTNAKDINLKKLQCIGITVAITVTGKNDYSEVLQTSGFWHQ
jgi:hypothetical protein